MVHCAVNGNLLLTSNLAAEKHINLSKGCTGHSIWCLCLLPSLQSINLAFKFSKSPLDYEHIFSKNLCASFPMLHEQLKDGSSSSPHYHMPNIIRVPDFTPPAELRLEPKAGTGHHPGCTCATLPTAGTGVLGEVRSGRNSKGLCMELPWAQMRPSQIVSSSSALCAALLSVPLSRVCPALLRFRCLGGAHVKHA